MNKNDIQKKRNKKKVKINLPEQTIISVPELRGVASSDCSSSLGTGVPLGDIFVSLILALTMGSMGFSELKILGSTGVFGGVLVINLLSEISSRDFD